MGRTIPPVLSKEQMRSINDNLPADAKYGEVFEAIAVAQRDDTYNRCIQKLGKMAYLLDDEVIVGKGNVIAPWDKEIPSVIGTTLEGKPLIERRER